MENMFTYLHIEHDCNGVFKSIGIMQESRHIPIKHHIKQLYFSFIHSKYCLEEYQQIKFTFFLSSLEV